MKQEQKAKPKNSANYLNFLGGVLFVVQEDLSIEFCSEQALSILGYAQKDVIETPHFLEKNIHPDFLKVVKQTIGLAKLSDKVHTINLKFKFENNKYRWLQAQVHKVIKDDELRFSIFCTDIHQHQLEFERREEDRALNTELLKHLSHVFFLFTPDGKFIRWNNRLVEVSGYSNEEIKEMNPLNFFPEKVKPYIQDMIQAVLEQGRIEMEAIFESRDGTIKPIHFIGSRFIYKKEVCISGVAIDISLQKNSEKELRTSEKRFRALVQQGADMIAILNEKGEYIYVSANHKSIVGYEEGFLLGKNGFDFFHENDKERVLKEFVKLQTQSRVTSSPYRFKKSDGSYCWMQSVGTNMTDDDAIKGIIVNSIEITSLIEAQRALHVSNELYENINKLTNDAIYDWDIVNDSFRWGEGFGRIFGHNIDEKFTLLDWRKLEHPEGQKKNSAAWEEFFKDSNRSKWHNEIRVKNSKGRYLYTEEIGHVIRSEAGVPTRMIGVLRDISKRKEEELKHEIQHEVTKLFSLDKTLAAVLQEITHFLRKKFSLPIVEIWINSDNGMFTNKTAFSVKPVVEDVYVGNTISKVQYGEGSPGTVWQNDKIEIWKDKKLVEDFVRKHILAEVNIKTVIGVPIINKGQNIGQLVFMINKTNSNKPSWVRSMNFLCNQLGDEIVRKRQEVELKLLFNSAPDILAVAGAEKKFIEVNPAFCKLLGYTAKEITSRPFTDFLHPNDVMSTTEEYSETIINEKQSHGFLNRYRTKDGNYKWISWSSSEKFGVDGYVFCYGRDITQLMQTQNMLDGATNLSRTGAWEYDVVKDDLFWSSMTREIYGVEVNFQPTLEVLISFFRRDFEPAVRDHIEKCINDAIPFDIEAILVSKQGEQCWVRIIGSSEEVNNECVRIFGSIQDISEQKRIESKLKQLNLDLKNNMLDLEKSNKELEQFAFVASHDLQEPLRMVNSFLTLLEKKYKDSLDEKARSYIDFAVKGSHRMKSIILDLLEFSRAGDGSNKKIDTIDLNKVFEDLNILLKKQIEDAGVKLKVEKLPPIQGNYTQLRQVFQNLLSNAIKYRDKTRKLNIVITSKEYPLHYLISVKDNGIGIEEKYYQKIFELFQRLHAKEQYSGTGIGLAITKKIIESFGGEISIKSKVGKGSTFTIKIPKQIAVSESDLV